MSGNMQNRRKRNKKMWYGVYSGPCMVSKRPRVPKELEPGMQGILITCNMKERNYTAEAYSLLNEYADQLYGPEQLIDPTDGVSEDDMEAALQREVQHFHSSNANQKRRFKALESGANNVLFVRTHNIDPGDLVHCILQDLYTTRTLKSKVIFRMLPVYGSCRAFPDDMMKFLYSFLQPWFLTPKQATYQICYKSRNNSHSKREDIMKYIAGLVSRLNPKNKVDLTNPELTIIIEVIKLVCCVSVIRDYKRFRKYNLQEVSKGPASPGSSQPEESEGAATEDPSRPEASEGAAKEESAKPEASEGPAKEESAQPEASEGPAKEESAHSEASEGMAREESAQTEASKGPAKEVPAQPESSEGPAKEVPAQPESSEGPAKEVPAQPESSEGPAKEVPAQPESSEGPAKEVPAQPESSEGPAKEELAQQEASEGPAKEESAQQEAQQGPAKEEASQQEANEESAQQDVDMESTSEELSHQEMGENKASQEQGEQEVPKDLVCQEKGQQEVAESKANEIEEENEGGESEIKEAE